MGVLVEDVRSSECGDQHEQSGFLHCAAQGETVSRFGRNDGFLMVWRKTDNSKNNADCGLRTGVVEKQISPLRGPR